MYDKQQYKASITADMKIHKGGFLAQAAAVNIWTRKTGYRKETHQSDT